MKRTTILLFAVLVSVIAFAVDKAALNKDLLNAAAAGQPSKVADLIKQGADPNAMDEKGSSALMKAVYNRNREVVQTLIRAKANVNARDGEGMTALMRAANAGYAEIAEDLTRAGADLNTKDST